MDRVNHAIRLVTLFLIGAQILPQSNYAYFEHPAFVVRVNEVVDFESEVYVNRSQTEFVLLSSRLTFAMLIDLYTKRFSAYANSDFVQNVDRRQVDLRAIAKPSRRGICNMAGTSVACRYGDVMIAIVPRPHLNGEVSLQQLYAHSQHYRKVQASYMPDVESIQSLRSRTKPIEIRVYFGTWSSICREVVPEFLAVVAGAANPNLRIRLIAINKEMNEPSALVVGEKILQVPTFYVCRNGKEIATFSHRSTGVERKLAKYLSSR